MRNHFRSFVMEGNDNREIVSVRFPQDSSRVLKEPFQVKFVDGQTKVLIMMCAVMIAHKLSIAVDAVDTFASYKYIKATYCHREDEEQFHFDALSVSSESRTSP